MTSLLARSAAPARPTDEALLAARLVPRPRPARLALAVLAVALVAFAVQSAVRNPRFEWDVVWVYLRAPAVAHGLWLTIWLTATTLVCGYAIGVGVAAMRLSGNPVLRAAAFGYVWLFRSVPPLVQLLFWYELASLYPRLGLGVPFGAEWVGVDTAHLFSGLVAAFVALTLDVGAFAAEIVRGGLLSVPRAQIEAAQSLGLGARRIFRRIVLPQAMPAIVPASGNLLIGLLKATSIVSVIAVSDLLYSVQLVYGQNYRIMPLLIVATIWYVVLTSVLSFGQYLLERHYARSRRSGRPRPLRQVVRANVPLWGRGVRAGSRS